MISATLANYAILSGLIFSIALIGIMMNRNNFIKIIIAIELMLLAANINFLIGSTHYQNPEALVAILTILAMAAIEVVIGLAMVVIFYKLNNHIDISKSQLLEE